jgi:hypothetical protein
LWDNDLEFPPNHVVKQGTRAVVSFLKEKLREMEHGHSSSDEETTASCRRRPPLESLSPHSRNIVTKGTVRDDKRTQKMSAKQDRLFTGPSLPLPVPQQAPVHTEQPETSTERRINYSSKVPHPVAMRSSNIGTDTSGTLSVKRSKRPTYSEPAHQQDESSNPMQKAEIDAAIEKQKSQEYLSSWRQETKSIQLQTRMDAARGKRVVYTRAAELAPFGTDLQPVPNQPASTARDQMNAMEYHRDSVREFSKPSLLPNSQLRAKVSSVKDQGQPRGNSEAEEDWSHDWIDPSRRAREYRLQAFVPGFSCTSPKKKQL